MKSEATATTVTQASDPFIPQSKSVITKDTAIINTVIPDQPIPINADNFFVRTRGVWDLIVVVPDEYIQIFKSKKSVYWRSPDGAYLIRKSDHWGWGIRFCDWFLKFDPESGYNHKISASQFRKIHHGQFFIGKIHIHNLTPNKAKHKKYKNIVDPNRSI